jgi:hypothetical protein
MLDHRQIIFSRLSASLESNGTLIAILVDQME